MRKRAILILGAALLVATAGVIYAHWEETLTVDANITTGDINPVWSLYGTNDDYGLPGAGSWAGDGEPTAAPVYSYYTPAGSRDPSEPWADADRYDKDVAQCVAALDGSQGIDIDISNGYPSYWCTVKADLHNTGTVPVKLQSTSFSIPDEIAVGLQDAPFMGCGYQLDPGESVDFYLTFHVKNTALESTDPGYLAPYHIDLDFTWRNWNEYEPGGNCPFYSGVSLTNNSYGSFSQVWDLTSCDLEVAFTYDGNGLVDDFGGATAHAYPQLGVRQVGGGNFNPNALGIWMAADYDWAANTFDPDVTPTLDLDDKFVLQRIGGQAEGAYNLPSVPPVPGNNYRFWWDRDGVDPWQNPETANTGGIYNVVLQLHATDATNGTAYMSIRNLYQGFEVDGNWSTIELTPAGMTWTGDMANMQVFYGIWGYGASHSVAFRDITVSGCLGS